MGMDVVGKNPANESGEYFRANVWSWHPIQQLIVELCSDLLNEKTLRGLSVNDGRGVKDQKTCTEMANRFAAWMEHNIEGHTLEQDEIRVTKEGRLVRPSESEGMETVSPYRVTDEHLKEWIEFLRNCGGFEVW